MHQEKQIAPKREALVPCHRQADPIGREIAAVVIADQHGRFVRDMLEPADIAAKIEIAQRQNPAISLTQSLLVDGKAYLWIAIARRWFGLTLVRGRRN